MAQHATISGGECGGDIPKHSDPDSGVSPTMTIASNEPAKVYAYDHRNLNANVQNLYSNRGLAAANAFGMSSPIAVEDEDLLNQSPSPADSTTNGSTIATGAIFQDNNYQGVINQVHNGPKHGKIILWSSVDDQVWMQMPFSSTTLPRPFSAAAKQMKPACPRGFATTMSQALAIAARTPPGPVFSWLRLLMEITKSSTIW